MCHKMLFYFKFNRGKLLRNLNVYNSMTMQPRSLVQKSRIYIISSNVKMYKSFL